MLKWKKDIASDNQKQQRIPSDQDPNFKPHFIDGIEIPPDDIMTVIDSPFIHHFNGTKIFYTKDFYQALNKKLNSGMSAIEAYEALGFSTAVLGENRARQAAKHAKDLAAQKRLYTKDPSCYDGSVPREMMGDMEPAEELAWYKARVIYLETMAEMKKKLMSELEELIISSKAKK